MTCDSAPTGIIADVILLNQGEAVESYARRLAGALGVPDFVYHPSLVRTGSGSREVGDGLLVVGDTGLILQVKSRDVGAASRDDTDKAERWCRKHAARARGQGMGTRRRLQQGGVEVTSLRGHSRTLPSTESWPVVVILDHPLDPAVSFEPAPDTVYLSMSDWLGLHSLIRSTHGLIGYVRRALASGMNPRFGQESSRYARLADADARTSGSPTSVPVLPPEPLDDEDQFAADLFTDLVERVADPTSLGWHPEAYLRIVERLDREPTLVRVRLGRRMMSRFEEMLRSRSARGFLAMDADTRARVCVLYDYDHSPSADPRDRSFDSLLVGYTTMRHIQAIEAGEDAAVGTLGVGVLHHPQEGRRYSFILLEDTSLSLPAEIRRSLESQFGVFNGKEMVQPESPSDDGV